MGMKPRLPATGISPLSFDDFARINLKALESSPYYNPEDDLLSRLQGLHPTRDLLELFGDGLQGVSPSARYLALRYYASECRQSSKSTRSGGMVKEPLLCMGDLHVEGTLLNSDCIVVLGDLTITGNYLAFLDYPLLYVGGRLRVHNLFLQETESICLEGIEAERVATLVRNHTVTIAKSLQAKTLIMDDVSLDATINATHVYEDGGYQVYADTFDLTFDADADDFDADEHIVEQLISMLRD